MPIKETLCHLILLLLLRAASVSASWITDQSVRRCSIGRTRRPMYAHPPDTTTTTQPITVSSSSSSSSSSSPLFWKERIRVLQKTVEEQKKMYKIQTHQTLLKDRATYLATRALYMQTQMYHPSFLNQTRERMTMEPQQQQQLQQREPYWPAPTLSYSATRNYKRKQDVIVALPQQQQQGGILVEKEDPRNNKQKYKKGEQGKQFQHACNVYIRLLEALDDIRNQATIQGTLFVRQLERQKAISTTQTTTASSVEMNLNTTETLLWIHQRHFHRMKLLIQLALHANHHAFFFQEQQEQKLGINATALESIDTQDLLQAIYIRGNLPKNKWKRLPKKRSKVLEYFQQSYSYPLFHV